MFLVFTLNVSSEEIIVSIGGEAPMRIEEDGKLTGFDVDVMNAVAKDMGVGVRYNPTTFHSVFENVKSGKSQVGVSAITINSEREKEFNFTHPYKKSGLSILVRDEPAMDILGALSKVFFGDLSNVWIFFGIFTLIMGFLIYWSEHEFNSFGDGVWWTIVTSTTVGYGDLAPKTTTGRVLACIVMLVGICTTGILIGAFSAVFNTQIIKYDINGVDDLSRKKVSTVSGTTSVSALKKAGAWVYETDTLKEAILLLEAKRVDALVYDDPIIKHIAKENDNLVVVGDMFDLQDYGFLLAKDNIELRETLNRSILNVVENGTISKLELKWFSSK